MNRRAELLLSCAVGAALVAIVTLIATSQDVPQWERYVTIPAIVIVAVIIVAELLLDRERDRYNNAVLDSMRLVNSMAQSATHPGSYTPTETSRTATQTMPAQPVAPAPPKSVNAAPLAQFVVNDFRSEAQCPHCGRYMLDIDASSTAIARFRCRSCNHQWEWQQGTPWPDVTIRANLAHPDHP